MSGRHKNANWNCGGSDALGTSPSIYGAQLAVLMDLRDELKEIRSSLSGIDSILNCSNFTAIPRKIEAIRINTARKKRAPTNRT